MPAFHCLRRSCKSIASVMITESAGLLIMMQCRYRKLGTPWATSLLGFFTLAMAPIPLLFYLYGPWLRQRSKFHLWTVQLDEDDASREREARTGVVV